MIDSCIQPTHGNQDSSVMVLGAIHHGERRNLVILGGTMKMHRYIQILNGHMLPLATGFFGRNLVSAQDNAPPHVAHGMMAFLHLHDVGD